MKDRLTPTAFLGIDNAHEADAYDILILFRCHSHVYTRSQCLAALKNATAGKGPEGYFSFSGSCACKSTYDLFEDTIKGLYQLLAKVEPVGIWRKDKLEDWYREAIEIMMDAYLRVASDAYMKQNSDVNRPLGFMFQLIKEGKSPVEQGKALKHALFYASAYFGKQKDVDDVKGLEKFLTSRLNHFVNELCGEKFDQRDWEPAKKILDFMVDRSYYRKGLVRLVRQMKELLEARINIEGKRSSEDAHKKFMRTQAISLAEYVLNEPGIA